MSAAPQYEAPDGPPPGKPIHQDAGPYYPSQEPAFFSNNAAPIQNWDQDRGFGSPAPQQQQQWGPPQGGYHQPQQQGPMYYGQQPYGQPQGGPGYYGQPYGPQQGSYGNRNSGMGGGVCAGLMAALACCCCVDFLI